jgi:hypothetical protein
MKTATAFAIYERDVTEVYTQLKAEGDDVEESVRIDWFMQGGSTVRASARTRRTTRT